MKLSTTVRVILGAIIFAIGLGVAYMLYTQSLAEQESLKARMPTSQVTMPRVSTEVETLQASLAKVEEQMAKRRKELASAEGLLTKAKTVWPASVERLEYNGKL